MNAFPGLFDEADFGVVFAQLARQLRWQDATPAIVASYYAVLRDLPVEDVKAAAEGFAREADRRFPPTSAEWHGAASQLATERERRQFVSSTGGHDWREECPDCHDTGWQQWECDGGLAQWPEHMPAQRFGTGRPWRYRAQPRATATPQASICRRSDGHPPHAFVTACPCRERNRTYQRHHGRVRT